MPIKEPELLVGVNAGLNGIHTILLREEADGRLRLIGEHRDRQVVQKSDEMVFLRRIKESIENGLVDANVSLADILAIGVALPGQIDMDGGTVVFSPVFNMKEHSFPFVARLHEYLDVPHIALIGDHDAQGISEKRIGMGKETRDLVYLHIGHGVEASIIFKEELYTGANNLAGAFGHTIVDLNGPKCTCGNRGCLNAIVSRSAIEEKLMQRYKEGETTILASELNKEPLNINLVVIAEAIDLADSLTCRVVEEVAEVLGIGIANIINFLNPQRVILGGDIIDEIDLFFDKAIESAKKRSLQANLSNVSIVHGMLGAAAGVYGAAIFAKWHLSQ